MFPCAKTTDPSLKFNVSMELAIVGVSIKKGNQCQAPQFSMKGRNAEQKLNAKGRAAEKNPDVTIAKKAQKAPQKARMEEAKKAVNMLVSKQIDPSSIPKWLI